MCIRDRVHRVHVWRTVCSVCATGARVVHHFPSSNLWFLEVSAAPSRCCFKSLSMWTGTGWIEFPTEWNLCKRVRARGGGACACLAHGLQCLRDRRACCPVVPKQLVICRFLRFHRRRSRCCFKSLLHWTGTGWFEFPTEWNLCKRVRARSGGA